MIKYFNHALHFGIIKTVSVLMKIYFDVNQWRLLISWTVESDWSNYQTSHIDWRIPMNFETRVL